jgi:curved DNA-binding protein CbpA
VTQDRAGSNGNIDPYRELGISHTATQRAIRAAYHARARLRHPDMGGDAEAMARVNAAYELLKDPSRRAAFDTAQSASSGNGKSNPFAAAGDAPPWTGAAGPPPGRPSGPVLDFGIFAGWSLGEIARRDPGYLAWLAERPEGAPFLDRIQAIIQPMREAAKAPAATSSRRRRFRG